MAKSKSDSWDEGEKQNILQKYKLRVIYVGVSLLGIPAYLLLQTNPLSAVYSDYIKHDYQSAAVVAEEIANTNTNTNADRTKALQVLYRIHSDSKSAMFDVNKSIFYGQELFLLKKSEVFARDILSLLEIAGQSFFEKEVFLVYLAGKNDQSAIFSLVNHFSKIPGRDASGKIVKLLSKLPETAGVKMKLAKVYLSRESGIYSERRGMELVASAYKMGSADASAYLALDYLEQSKASNKEKSKLIGKFVFYAGRALDGGYIGELHETIVNTIELGRFGVPRDPSFSENHQPAMHISPPRSQQIRMPHE